MENQQNAADCERELATPKRMQRLSVRGKVMVELSAIALSTTIFLVLFPRRSPVMVVALAGFALLCIALSAPYTKKVIWAASPSPVREHRLKRCLAVTFWITLPPALSFLLIGGIVAHHGGRWHEFAARVFSWRILIAFCCY